MLFKNPNDSTWQKLDPDCFSPKMICICVEKLNPLMEKMTSKMEKLSYQGLTHVRENWDETDQRSCEMFAALGKLLIAAFGPARNDDYNQRLSNLIPCVKRHILLAEQMGIVATQDQKQLIASEDAPVTSHIKP